MRRIVLPVQDDSTVARVGPVISLNMLLCNRRRMKYEVPSPTPCYPKSLLFRFVCSLHRATLQVGGLVSMRLLKVMIRLKPIMSRSYGDSRFRFLVQIPCSLVIPNVEMSRLVSDSDRSSIQMIPVSPIQK